MVRLAAIPVIAIAVFLLPGAPVQAGVPADGDVTEGQDKGLPVQEVSWGLRLLTAGGVAAALSAHWAALRGREEDR